MRPGRQWLLLIQCMSYCWGFTSPVSWHNLEKITFNLWWSIFWTNNLLFTLKNLKLFFGKDENWKHKIRKWRWWKCLTFDFSDEIYHRLLSGWATFYSLYAIKLKKAYHFWNYFLGRMMSSVKLYNCKLQSITIPYPYILWWMNQIKNRHMQIMVFNLWICERRQ